MFETGRRWIIGFFTFAWWESVRIFFANALNRFWPKSASDASSAQFGPIGLPSNSSSDSSASSQQPAVGFSAAESTPMGPSYDPNVFTGKNIVETAIGEFQSLKVEVDQAKEEYLNACLARSHISKEPSPAKLGAAIGDVEDDSDIDPVAICEQVLGATTRKLNEQYKLWMDRIKQHYEKLTSDSKAMDGFKKLLPSELGLVFDVFDSLNTKNILNDGIIFRMAHLFENHQNYKQFLAALVDLVHQSGSQEQIEDYLNKVLLGIGDINLMNVPDSLQYVPVPGDGNCMYSSVLYHTPQYSKLNSQGLRALMAQHVRKNLAEYENVHLLRDGKQYKSMEDYLIALEFGKDFAEEYDINILMGVIACPIVIIDPEGRVANGAAVKNACKAYPQAQPIFIHYNGRNHYSCLVIKENRNANEVLRELLPELSTAAAVVL